MDGPALFPAHSQELGKRDMIRTYVSFSTNSSTENTRLSLEAFMQVKGFGRAWVFAAGKQNSRVSHIANDQLALEYAEDRGKDAKGMVQNGWPLSRMEFDSSIEYMNVLLLKVDI